MPLSDDERTLLIVAPLFLAAIVIWLFVLNTRGKILLRTLREKLEPSLFDELGAPESLQDTIRDPERRWHRFIRSGDYRRRLSPELAELIDEHRRRTNRMLIVFGIAGVALLVRFWPLLKPDFL